MKSNISSAAVSILKLSAYSSISGSTLITLITCVAPDLDPVTVSPIWNPAHPTVATSRTLVSSSHTLTRAVVVEAEPVTISLKIKLPLDQKSVSETVIVGAILYPAPALVILIAVIVPAVLTTAVAAAPAVVTPASNISLLNVI